jgi:hypothetical protein
MRKLNVVVIPQQSSHVSQMFDLASGFYMRNIPSGRGFNQSRDSKEGVLPLHAGRRWPIGQRTSGQDVVSVLPG